MNAQEAVAVLEVRLKRERQTHQDLVARLESRGWWAKGVLELAIADSAEEIQALEVSIAILRPERQP